MKNQPSFQVRLTVVFLLACVPALFAQPHWPQFRGPNGTGISSSAQPPVQFGPDQNVLWKYATPAGYSSPCVWGDRVFLTGVDGNNLITLAIDRSTGKELWRKEVAVEKLEEHHPTSSPVTATPAADGERLYVYFGSFGLLAYRHDGQEVWRKPMPIPKSKYGMASSPILYKDALIQLIDTDGGDSRLLALNRKTGEPLWTQERTQFTAGWSTPLIWSHDGQDDLVALGISRLMAYDPQTGAPRWWVDGFPQETVNSPVVGDGMLFASSAALGGRGNEKTDPNAWRDLLKMDRNGDGKLQFNEIPDDYRLVLRPDLPKDHPGYAFPAPFKAMYKRADTDKDDALSEEEMKVSMGRFETFTKPVLMAIRPGGKEDAKQNVAWEMRRGIAEIPSPLYFQGAIYMVRDGGLVTCIAAKDGSVRYQERLGVGGQYAATPVAAAD
jgi:outer membrane protein assembly factor BamB